MTRPLRWTAALKLNGKKRRALVQFFGIQPTSSVENRCRLTDHEKRLSKNKSLLRAVQLTHAPFSIKGWKEKPRKSRGASPTSRKDDGRTERAGRKWAAGSSKLPVSQQMGEKEQEEKRASSEWGLKMKRKWEEDSMRAKREKKERVALSWTRPDDN